MIELLIFIEFTIGEEGLMGKERKVYGIVAVGLFFAKLRAKFYTPQRYWTLCYVFHELYNVIHKPDNVIRVL